MTAAPRVALVTCARLGGLTDDDQLLAVALERRGIAPEPVVWTRAGRLNRFDAAVLRSTWDYHLKPSRFDAWVRGAARQTRLLNPAPLVRWNARKRYLRYLERRGIPVTPTLWVGPRQLPGLARAIARRGWSDLVIKPEISATAFQTIRATAALGAAERRHVTRLARRGLALVQPWLPAVAERGEWSLVFLGGRYSHAALKRPAAGDFRVQEEFGGSSVAATPPPALIRAARAALRAAPLRALYARVDMLAGPPRPLLMELELIEPVLFFGLAPGAAGRLAAAIDRIVRS